MKVMMVIPLHLLFQLHCLFVLETFELKDKETDTAVG